MTVSTTDATATTTARRISRIRRSSRHLPLAQPISDAEELTRRQHPMTELAMLLAEIDTEDGPHGSGLNLTDQARVWSRGQKVFGPIA
jgi:hypothetical protein